MTYCSRSREIAIRVRWGTVGDRPTVISYRLESGAAASWLSAAGSPQALVKLSRPCRGPATNHCPIRDSDRQQLQNRFGFRISLFITRLGLGPKAHRPRWRACLVSRGTGPLKIVSSNQSAATKVCSFQSLRQNHATIRICMRSRFGKVARGDS